MSIRTVRYSVLLLLAGSLACASSGTQSSAPSSGSKTVRSPTMISTDEIVEASASNAYELVQRLRPQWLRTGGVASIGGGAARQGTLVAYLDNVRLGQLNELRTVPAAGIRSIRYLNAEQAMALETTAGLIVGAVVVNTR